MAISIAQYRIAYMALPKAACSTVKAALARIDPDVTLPPEAEHTNPLWHKIYPTIRYRAHRFQQYADHWRFCVIRDPAERLISCYTDRVVKRGELHHSRRIRRGEVNLPADPDPDFFFQNPLKYASAASVIKHHSLPAYLFLGPTLDNYDAVYPMENLPQLARDLSERTGQAVPFLKKNASGASLTLDDLKPKTLKALRKVFALEYGLVEGYYDNPLETAAPRRRLKVV